MRVLLVEDDLSISRSLEKALSNEGFTVDAVNTGEAALFLVTRTSVDVVILDIGLPDMDGLSVLKKIREHNKSLPVILLTARVVIKVIPSDSDRSWIGSAKFTAKSDVDFTARLVVVHDIKVVESCFQDDLEPPAKVLELERQLLPAVRRIEQQLSSVAPANYTTWADARYAKLGILRDIFKAHIQALQQLAPTCPGGLLGTASQS